MPSHDDVWKMGPRDLKQFLTKNKVDWRDARNREELRGMALAFADGGGAEADYDSVLSNWKHLTEGITQPEPDSPEALPIGYMLGRDEEGLPIFVNLNENPPLETYDDPRIVEEVERRPGMVVKSAKQGASKRPRGRTSMVMEGSKADPRRWKIAPMDEGAFKQLPWKLEVPSKLPVYGRAHPTPNRYNDILPTAGTRVKLNVIGGNPATEYINANHVVGDPSWGINYIAAQGPTKATINQHLRMIFEKKCEAVVMLTRLREGKKQKCAAYIPPPGPGKSHTIPIPGGTPIKVTTMGRSVQIGGYFLTEMEFSQGTNVLKVKHYWYKSWPDHGVPRDDDGDVDTDDLLELLDDMRTNTTEGAAVMVHCSAGIGRTGTYIGMDVCTRLLEKTGACDVVKVVDRMRNDRGALVQHAAQLVYLHAAVEEYRNDRVAGGEAAGGGAAAQRFVEYEMGPGKTVKFPVGGAADEGLTPKQAQGQGINYKMFKEIDTDKSGTITAMEMKAFIAQHVMKQRTEARDRAGARRRESIKGGKAPARVRKSSSTSRLSVADGELDLGTVQFNKQFFAFHDVDGDGEMDLQEALLQGMTERMFKDIDLDGDGRVTKEEFRVFRERQQIAPK